MSFLISFLKWIGLKIYKKNPKIIRLLFSKLNKFSLTKLKQAIQQQTSYFWIVDIDYKKYKIRGKKLIEYLEYIFCRYSQMFHQLFSVIRKKKFAYWKISALISLLHCRIKGDLFCRKVFLPTQVGFTS